MKETKKVKSDKKKEYLTLGIFEKHMGSIARSFHSVDERFNGVDKRFKDIDERFRSIDERFNGIDERLDRHEKVFETILHGIRNLHEDNKYMRSTLTGFVRDTSVHGQRIDDLTIRVERLEQKVK